MKREKYWLAGFGGIKPYSTRAPIPPPPVPIWGFLGEDLMNPTKNHSQYKEVAKD
ncbi:hypothetical protein NIES39_C04810 [Arthrospira platensis NIES-39]|nr:hypothetical protein NIES39_C04810 [Arthrospira platensis NIES-39]